MLCGQNAEGGTTTMTAPSTMVSLRLPDDILAELDRRVGFDGMRNRSDVIREAVRSYLKDQPTLANMSTVSIAIGVATRKRLAQLYQLQGITPEMAASQGLLEYVERATAASLDDTDNKLQSRIDEILTDTLPSREYTE